MNWRSHIILALTAAPALAAETAANTTPSIASSVIRMIGALCIVLSLLFAGVWAFRNSGKFAPGRGRTAKLKVLESRSLGHRHAVFVIGYDQQRLLLSSSPTGVTLLTHLPEATAEETRAEESPAPALPNFSTALAQALALGRK